MDKDAKLQDLVNKLKQDMGLKAPTLQYDNNNVLCGSGVFANQNFKMELTWQQLIDQGFFSKQWDEMFLYDAHISTYKKIQVLVVEEWHTNTFVKKN